MKGFSFSKVKTAIFAGAVAMLATNAAAMSCKGTIFFQPPASWGDNVYAAGCGQFYKASKGASGWYEITGAAATAAGVCSDDFKFTNSTNWNGAWFSTVGTNEGQNGGDPFNCANIPGDYYIQEDPSAPGKSWASSQPPNAKYLYILIPEEKEWMISNPMISLDGTTANVAKLRPDPERCGWYYHVYFNEEPTDNAYIYRDDDPEDQIGMNGLWSDAFEPMALASKYAELQTDMLFFIPDDGAWPDDGSTSGWYKEDSGVEGVCTYSIAALIYDTDASVNDLFSEYQGVHGPYTETCTGVRKGIVKDVLGPDNKPQLNVGSPNATACFGGNEALFNSLFNYTAGKNEVTCYDLPFTREADGRWGYNSDLAVTGTTTGGFYPVENTTDANIVTLNGVTMGPLAAARIKRGAEGPVDVASVPAGVSSIDYACKGPGWDGGIDCEGMFVSDDETGVKWQWDKSPTGGARWGSQNRNQHFCFESHASFVYDPNQQFTFRGDDDIWVFIAGKLAVDNGGAHLAAPGHVVLSTITDAAGNPLVPGQTYNLDIFFCDRRTTMSNVIIKTNMYIKQSSGLSTEASKNPDGSADYNLCWDESGDGSCAATALGQSGGAGGAVHACGADVAPYVGALKYYITTRAGDLVEELKTGGVVHGGIDLTDPFKPKLNTAKIGGFAPGSYRLVIEIPDKGKKTYINFRMKGNLDLVTKDSKYAPLSGDETSPFYKPGTVWDFPENALAGTRIPLYISAVTESDIDLLSAINQSYSLTLGAGVQAYATSDPADVTPVAFPRTIDTTGIDTVWVEMPLAGLTASPELKEVASLKATAMINFFAPQLKFVRDVVKDSVGNIASYTVVAGDPDKDADGAWYYNWMGSDVDLSIIAFNPIDSSICKECSFNLALIDGSSRVDASASAFNNGLAAVTVVSDTIYWPADDAGFAARAETAFITMAASESELVQATYGNMYFREPPCPTPTVVELHDTHGEKPAFNYSIPAPYFDESKEYLDGIADSLVIVYHRPFGKDASGSVPNDSLPNFICLNWDVENDFNLQNYVFNAAKGLTSSIKKDTLVACSDTLGFAQIKAAFDARPNDSTLVFHGVQFSKDIKTADPGTGTGLEKVQVRSWATYEDRGNLTVASFDKKISDKIAPVIVEARIRVEKGLDNISFVFSEPLKAASADVNLRKALSYYVFSAGTADAAKYPFDGSRYSPNMNFESMQNLSLSGTTAMLSYTEGNVPTPQKDDYVRIDGLVLTDTAGNAPKAYDAAIPSPWTIIDGEARSRHIWVTYSTLNANDPEVQKRMQNKETIVKVAVDKTSDKATMQEMFPNMVGVKIEPDMSYYKNEFEGITANDLSVKYEIYYFTNLGGFVASDKGEIECTDAMFDGDCLKNPKYVYIGWTGVTNDGRLAGSGVYVSKATTTVIIDTKTGKKVKKNKKESTSTNGFRRINK